MTKSRFKFGLAAGFIAVGLGLFVGLFQVSNVSAQMYYQQPTVSIPTVTGTPRGVVVRVTSTEPQINIRSGPSLDYPKVGVLIAAQEVTAVGRSPGGDWIQVAYNGVAEGVAWVYAFYVSAPSQTLPIVVPPATPTPRVTPTIDPTLVGQFNLESTPTRLPTFTPPPPIIYRDFEEVETGLGARIPFGMVIFGLLILGVFGALVSLIRGR